MSLKELAELLEVPVEDLKPSKEELVKLIEPLIPSPVKGEDGSDGVDGKDYILTRQDKKDIASEIKVPVVEKVIERTEVVKEITNEVKEVAKYESAEEIAFKLNTLEEVIDWTVIKGLKEKLKELEPKFMGGIPSRTTKVFGETYVATNGQTDFTLLYPPLNGTVQVHRGGARQNPSGNYTISGSTISFITPFQTDEEALFDYER